MTHRIRMMIVAAVAALVNYPMAAYAQTPPMTLLRVSVNLPFAFSCGNHSLPAGDYTLTVNDNDVLTLSGKSAAAVTMAHVHYNPQPTRPSQAVFNQYGGRYFLEELTIDQAGMEISIPQSNTERRLAKDWAMNREALSRKTLALLGSASDRR
jgi:hypothetical protein